jgi:HSP20 family molecular chaperone IbpA
VIEGFNIVNGRIINENYHHDFHCFVERNILIVYLVIPGFNVKSLLIKIKDKNIQFSGDIIKEFHHIYRGKKIEITGRLPKLVNPRVYLSQYNTGILKVKLSIIE